jgi:cytidyltransferase-like protein
MESFRNYVDARQADIALVPGSFKPPHKGHYEMVKQYSSMAKDVVVLISSPSAKSTRKTKTGTVITPELAKQIFDIYVSNLPNVTVDISPVPSPVGAVYDALEKLGGKRVMLGASIKDGDWKRWSAAQDYVEKKQLNVDVVPPESSAVDVVAKPDGTPYSASNIRDNIDNPEMIISDIPDHVDPNQIISLLTSV